MTLDPRTPWPFSSTFVLHMPATKLSNKPAPRLLGTRRPRIAVTEAEREQMRQFYKEGMSIKEIARQFGRGDSVIRRNIKRCE